MQVLTFIVTEMEEFARMETTNAVKLAEYVLSAVKHFKGELTAEGCRQALGKSYFSRGGLDLGDFQCSPRGVKLIPKGEDFMDLTWSKFIKFCRENSLIEEDAHPCKIKPAPSTDAAATAADPAAASPAATSTTWESGADAAASTPKPSSPDDQTPLSAPASPADAGAAAQNLSAAVPASLEAQPSASSAFDYSGLDRPTADALHWAEREICEARRDYVAKLAQAVYIAHDALCGGVVHNVDAGGVVANCDNSKHGHRGEDAFRNWCASVGLGKDTAYRLLQVAGLLNGATPEEQAVLEAASPSLLYAAAKPSAPAQLVQGVKDGDITTHKQYQELLAQLKAKEQELDGERASRKSENAAFSELLADEQQRRQAANEARIAAEKTAQEAKESCRTAKKTLAEVRDELRTKNQRIKELEGRPIEVRGADSDDIARWRSEGAKPVQDKLKQAQAEAAALRERVRELEASQTEGESAEVSVSRQIADTMESILRAQFEALDALPYEVFEAAVEPFETLRDKLSEALEFGTWPSGKENP